jgi:hypothetical protein
VVRSAFPALVAVTAALVSTVGAQSDQAAARAVGDALVWGRPMPAADALTSLPRETQQRAEEFRTRERMFHSTLTPPRGATDEERYIFEQRVAVERVLFCLFPRRDIVRVAAQYASDANVLPETGDNLAAAYREDAAFIDDLLRDASKPWLAPYLNLIAGHRKLCAVELSSADSDSNRTSMREAGRRQLAQARDAGHPLIRVAADHFLTSDRCDRP